MSERNCKNCACYAEVTLSPLAPPQSQCRRNGPMPAQIRVERPRINPITKEVMINKMDKKPLTEVSVENVFLYAPTAPEKVCFDGWRPLDTLPGEKRMDALYGRFLTPDKDFDEVPPPPFTPKVPSSDVRPDWPVLEEAPEETLQRNQNEQPGNCPHG